MRIVPRRTLASQVKARPAAAAEDGAMATAPAARRRVAGSPERIRDSVTSRMPYQIGSSPAGLE